MAVNATLGCHTVRELTEQGASSADLTDPVALAWTCQLVQLMVYGHDGILSQTWEVDKLT